MSGSAESEIRALQTALAGVHAALWGYSRLTPELPQDQQGQAREAYAAYRRRRARLNELLDDRDTEPVASRPGYELPHEVTDTASARKLAAHLEHGCTRVFGVLVEHARDGKLREYAADQLLACAKRERDWDGDPGALPGGGTDQDAD